MKKCNHKDHIFYEEKTFKTWGFEKAISFNICGNCGEISDLEEVILETNKSEMK